MRELDTIYTIPSGKTASLILHTYISAQNTYELQRLKVLYEYELSRNKRVEIQKILNIINDVLNERNGAK